MKKTQSTRQQAPGSRDKNVTLSLSKGISRQSQPGTHNPKLATRNSVRINPDPQNVWRTISIMNRMMPQAKKQMQEVAEMLSDADCKARALYDYMQRTYRYASDPAGVEYIRMPDQSYADRKKGIDCEDYALMVAAVLNIWGVPAVYRVVDFTGTGWSHIYVVATCPKTRKKTIIDPTHPKFNFQDRYKQKIDFVVGNDKRKGLGSISQSNNATLSLAAAAQAQRLKLLALKNKNQAFQAAPILKKYTCFEYKNDHNTPKTVKRELIQKTENIAYRIIEENERYKDADFYFTIGDYAAVSSIVRIYPEHDRTAEINAIQVNFAKYVLNGNPPDGYYTNKVMIMLLEVSNIDTAPFLARNLEIKDGRTKKEMEEKAQRKKEEDEREAKRKEDLKIKNKNAYETLKNGKGITFFNLLELADQLNIDVHPRTIGFIKKHDSNLVYKTSAYMPKGSSNDTFKSIMSLVDKILETPYSE